MAHEEEGRPTNIRFVGVRSPLTGESCSDLVKTVHPKSLSLGKLQLSHFSDLVERGLTWLQHLQGQLPSHVVASLHVAKCWMQVWQRSEHITHDPKFESLSNYHLRTSTITHDLCCKIFPSSFSDPSIFFPPLRSLALLPLTCSNHAAKKEHHSTNSS